MCWGPEPGFWAEESHSQGCSVHRSHRQPGGWRRSAAAGCLPVEKINTYVQCVAAQSHKHSHTDEGPHLENLFIKQTGSKHCDAIGVNLRIVAARQRAGHLLLAVQQQGHVFLGNRESDAVPPRDKEEEPQAHKCVM